jgi:hypothetical protein
MEVEDSPDVDEALMGAAQRNGVFVADLAAHGPRLGKAQMIRIVGPPLAEQARLRRDKSEMIFVAPPHRSQDAADAPMP